MSLGKGFNIVQDQGNGKKKRKRRRERIQKKILPLALSF
jgi:hypothetical protein